MTICFSIDKIPKKKHHDISVGSINVKNSDPDWKRNFENWKNSFDNDPFIRLI